MRRTASEIINSLESRIAKLEKQSSPKVYGRLELMTEEQVDANTDGEIRRLSGVREIKKAINDYNLTEVLSERFTDEIKLIPSDYGESQGYEAVALYLSKENIVNHFFIKLGVNVNK